MPLKLEFKSHPNAARLNNLLLIKLAETNKFLLELQSKGKDFSATQIKKEILFQKLFAIADAHISKPFSLVLVVLFILRGLISSKIRLNYLFVKRL